MNNQLQTIRLYGELGARYGRVHHLAVENAAEAVRALSNTFPGFDKHLMDSADRNVGYSVFYGKNNLDKTQLHDPCGNEDIRIAPMVLGSKNGGIFNIILGVILIVVGGFVSVASFGGAAPLGAAMINVGWGLVIGGVVQLLTPTPKGRSTKEKADNMPSYSFSGAVNTQAQGNPVPVLYGELIVGSAVINASIDAQDQAYIPVTGTPSGWGGGGGGGAPPWHMEWLNNVDAPELPGP